MARPWSAAKQTASSDRRSVARIRFRVPGRGHYKALNRKSNFLGALQEESRWGLEEGGRRKSVFCFS
jgi:hypothetical protein